MKVLYKKLFAVGLVAIMFFAFCGCGETATSRPKLNLNWQAKENVFYFSGQPSKEITLSENGANEVLSVVESQKPDYFLSYLYELDEVKSRLSFDANVENHQFSALNSVGVLDGGYLAEKVKQNNSEFLATKPFGYKAVEDDYVGDLCDFIVKVVIEMRQKYPVIDWQRVYCNLGNLKILYNTGMLSYAQVSDELILSISKNNTSIVLNMKGEDGFTRVLTHEIMHIIQIGCACEKIENCGRRAGISVYWDDFSLNTTDWTWMVEGSAERNMCALTGGEAVSYQYKMDYLCSLTMSVLVRDSVKADTMETLCFYSNTDLLFDAFGCKTEAERDEVLNMMITLQVLQMQPNNFMIKYKEETGIDLLADEEKLNQFCYSLKPSICITLAKEFYQNLTLFLSENKVAYNDVFFLINLFEGHLNQHLNFTSTSKAEINQPFIAAYTEMRSALFAALEKENAGLDFTSLYEEYEIKTGKYSLNATLNLLPKEKLEFLLERAEWQNGLSGLGQKVLN